MRIFFVIIDLGDNMQKKQFDNDNFVLYAPDSLKQIFMNMEEILDNSLNLYKDLFNVKDFRKVQINYFDNIEEFRNFIYDLRGEKESLPDYAVGTYDNGMINAYIDPSINIDSPMYNKRTHLASHELFHIMYKELIFDKYNIKRSIWFDEGCAQLFSGEKEYELNDGFSRWFNEVKKETKEIPDLNSLTHGENFKNEKYNGYNLSLFKVKTIYDKIGYEGLKGMLLDSNKVYKNGSKGELEASFLYYGMIYKDKGRTF